MRIKVAIATLLIAFTLGACAQFKSIETAIQLGTASVANPVTKVRLSQMEKAAIVVFAGLNTWKTSCAQEIIPPVCKTQIAGVQIYSRQIPPYLMQLRTFVKTNDQVNAQVVWNNVIGIIDTVKSQAAAGGVTISTTTTGS